MSSKGVEVGEFSGGEECTSSGSEEGTSSAVEEGNALEREDKRTPVKYGLLVRETVRL